jgi:hypothetical protein
MASCAEADPAPSHRPGGLDAHTTPEHIQPFRRGVSVSETGGHHPRPVPTKRSTVRSDTLEGGGSMSLTDREWWAVIHGMILGAIFLLAFAGGIAEFWSLRQGELTDAGVVRRTRRLAIGTWAMAAAAWLTVMTGSYIVYPWYRAEPNGAKFALLADPNTADWHEFGMEWKEHVAWIAPLLATAVAFTVTYYGTSLIRHQTIRKGLMVFFTAAFVIAAIAGALGAFITKAAPVG